MCDSQDRCYSYLGIEVDRPIRTLKQKRPMAAGDLLNIDDNPKTKKGVKVNVRTAIMYFAPTDLSGRNVCKYASPGCREGCLFAAGRGQMQSIKDARIRRTNRFFEEQPAFLLQLVFEIARHEIESKEFDMICAVRLNGTSDIPWERVAVIRNGIRYQNIMAAFKNVQFYDYTKYPIAKRPNLPVNYHLTFSLSESNDSDAREWLASGGNVAAVFADDLPETFFGYRVINADKDDTRFLDDQNVIAGLKAKGPAKKDTSGFVRRAA